MKSILYVGCAAIILCAGCASAPEQVQVPVRIEVPVPTKMVPPPELLACGQDMAGFRFYAPAPGSDDLVIRKDDQPAFQKWIEGKSKCISAWQEWAR